MGIFSAAESFEVAMEIEKNGKAFYDAASAKATDLNIETLFAELARQEQRHYDVFREMAETVRESASGPAVDDDEYRLYRQAMLDNTLFAGLDKGLALVDQAQDRQTVLRAAIGFEKDTLLFYYDLRDMVGESDRLAISTIIGEEKMHVQRLARAL